MVPGRSRYLPDSVKRPRRFRIHTYTQHPVLLYIYNSYPGVSNLTRSRVLNIDKTGFSQGSILRLQPASCVLRKRKAQLYSAQRHDSVCSSLESIPRSGTETNLLVFTAPRSLLYHSNGRVLCLCHHTTGSPVFGFIVIFSGFS